MKIMSVGKEPLAVLEKFAKLQTRIYPDACDYGIFAVPGDTNYQEISQAISELKEFIDYKVSTNMVGKILSHRKFAGFLAFEMDGPGKYCGVLIEVTWTVDTARKTSYFTLEINGRCSSDVQKMLDMASF
jgi:hypothetical protein